MNLSPFNEKYFDEPSKKTILNSTKHLETSKSPKMRRTNKSMLTK